MSLEYEPSSPTVAVSVVKMRERGFRALYTHLLGCVAAVDVTAEVRPSPKLILQKVFMKSFCKSQFPHNFFNLFFI